MNNTILFILIFFSQILLLSYYLPRKIRQRVKYIFKTFPPADFPKLYPKPIEVYKLFLDIFWGINLVILGAGMLILVLLSVKMPNLGPANPERWEQALVTAWFYVQFIPILLLEISSFKYFKSMREANVSSTRKAMLQPRRFFTFISPMWIGMAGFVYASFVIFIVYMRQFKYPWFGGYLNIVIITVSNLFFSGIALWNIYGKRLNPHQANEDRMNQIGIIVKQLVIVSIAVTLFAMLTITLHSLDLRYLQGTFMSVYFQLLAVVAFQTIRIANVNFDVYKED